MKRVSEVINNMASRSLGGEKRYVADWRDRLPDGSRWQPGDPGNPACKVCEGTGYVRLDLPVNHPDFGRIHWCDCVRR